MPFKQRNKFGGKRKRTVIIDNDHNKKDEKKHVRIPIADSCQECENQLITGTVGEYAHHHLKCRYSPFHKNNRKSNKSMKYKSTPTASFVGGEPEIWNFVRTFKAKDLRLPKKQAQLCDTEGCSLVASSVWESNIGEIWNTCLDCQVDDFAGWDPEEMPMMTKSHIRLMARVCSNEDDPDMPPPTD
mmetsp:Transcript_48826/g.72544  ORF Transcript_48826/g.72544 Transcript_48826/m.72544 type:complete len:186 (-) Transcript_48826:340-897(-)|eukprot:CAMPEP_0195519732 /NCGR_PEP_ID=MMETSP0794_2-20130614/15366_1 /TAXON_ID=515487 /ORGANISM="Stephanopyxis turris, Strain CCMP 815" /LENGTH=185 /DNA_ID=CAMNT_0040648935 /DNA_START=290 /DNA_END=847 /DNA_ORIENTATION=-